MKFPFMLQILQEFSVDNNRFYTNTVGVKFSTNGDSIISNNIFDSNDISSISLFGSHDNTINDNLISSRLEWNIC